MGPKRLSTIRQTLREALTKTGDDPIRWLEAQVANAKREGISRPGENEVLESLRQILEAPAGPKRKGRRLGGKK